MFDLNGKEFQGNTIFNGGVAGLVKNVEISIEKKQDDSNTPDYKLIVTDGSSSINAGFYYVTPNPSKSEEDNAKYSRQQVSRVLHIARAVLGKDYKFPNVSNAKEAYDVLFKLVADNCAGKKFNVYATYGTDSRPSKYLGLRYFNFIEPAGVQVSSLRLGKTDLLERLEEDAPAKDELSMLDAGNATSIDQDLRM